MGLKAPAIGLLDSVLQGLDAVAQQDERGVYVELHREGYLEPATEIDTAITLSRGERTLVLETLRLTVLGSSLLSVEAATSQMGWMPLSLLLARGWKADPAKVSDELLQKVSLRLRARLIAVREWCSREEPLPVLAPALQ